MSFKIGVYKNFTKLTGNHQWQSLFFNKAEGAAYKVIKIGSDQVFSC